jgi:hypothetical protein
MADGYCNGCYGLVTKDLNTLEGCACCLAKKTFTKVPPPQVQMVMMQQPMMAQQPQVVVAATADMAR